MTNADPIIQDMIDAAQSGTVINLRPYATDPVVVMDMIEQERSGMERRQHARSGSKDRRQR